MATTSITLKTATESLSFDARTGRLVSFRARHAPGQEFIASTPDHPVFLIQYLDAKGEYCRLTSFDARTARIRRTRQDGAEIRDEAGALGRGAGQAAGRSGSP